MFSVQIDQQRRIENQRVLKEVLSVVMENSGAGVVSKQNLHIALNEQGYIVVDKIAQDAADLVLSISTYYILLMLWSESAEVRMPHVDIPKNRPEWQKRLDLLEPVGYSLARQEFLLKKDLIIQ